jgi:hypothetical protein
MSSGCFFPLHPVNFNRASNPGKQPGSWKREEHMSASKWRSFPKVPQPLQYVISGNCFGKVKINGQFIRLSLPAAVWIASDASTDRSDEPAAQKTRFLCCTPNIFAVP